MDLNVDTEPKYSGQCMNLEPHDTHQWGPDGMWCRGVLGPRRLEMDDTITSDVGEIRITGKQVGDPRYLALLDELRELHLSKSHDYGFKDPLANLRAAEEFGIPAWVGCLLRANDKVTRIKSFLQSGTLKHESVEDSLMDIAAYALLALVLIREESE